MLSEYPWKSSRDPIYTHTVCTLVNLLGMPEDLNNLDDSESETNKIPMENHMQLGTKRSPSL